MKNLVKNILLLSTICAIGLNLAYAKDHKNKSHNNASSTQASSTEGYSSDASSTQDDKNASSTNK